MAKSETSPWPTPRLFDSASPWSNWRSHCSWINFCLLVFIMVELKMPSRLSSILFDSALSCPSWRYSYDRLQDFLTRFLHGQIEDVTMTDSKLPDSTSLLAESKLWLHYRWINGVIIVESKTLWLTFIMKELEGSIILLVMAKWKLYYHCGSLLPNEKVEWKCSFSHGWS